MASLRTKASLTSIVAFALIVLPLVYLLSYAPVVWVFGRTALVHEVITADVVETGVRTGAYGSTMEGTVHSRIADGSVYPVYRPVDWLIDNTPLREPMWKWAELWGVREEFEVGEFMRSWKPYRVPRPQY